MLVSITATEVAEEKIKITATNLEAILLEDDIYKKIDPSAEKKVTFIFDLKNVGHKKYLYKLCQSQRSAKDQESFGKMVEALVGCIVTVANGFLMNEDDE